MSSPTKIVEPNTNLRLATFMANLRFEHLPTGVVEHMKLCLLDTIGCALYGSTLPWSVVVRQTLSKMDKDGESPVWGTPHALSIPHAALANGAAVHAFEMDDLHPRSIVHPGSVVVPAAFAVAMERPGTTGAKFLTALVAGYETAARVGMTMGVDHLLAGWHPTGTHGSLGAAAAAGFVVGLSPVQMQNALGSAGSMSAGLMAAQFESMVKRLHAGRAAQSGVYSALLAENGFLGIDDVFDSPYGGYGSNFSPRYDPSPLTDSLGESWEVLNVGFKPYSCNGSCHPSVDAIRALRAQDGLVADDVERVDVYVSTATVKHVGWPFTPGNITTAQMNMPYIVAVALTDGDAFIEQFTSARVSDPALLEVSRRVHVHADKEVDARGDSARHSTRIEVLLRDGRTLTMAREYAHGSSREPLGLDEIRTKFGRLASTVLPERKLTRLAELIDSLETLQDLSEVSALLSVGRQMQ